MVWKPPHSERSSARAVRGRQRPRLEGLRGKRDQSRFPAPVVCSGHGPSGQRVREVCFSLPSHYPCSS